MQFYLKNPKESDSLIMMRIYDAMFKDGLFKYSTRQRIETHKWDHKKQWPKPGNDALIKVLNDFKSEASEYMMLNRKSGFTRESLRDHLTGGNFKPENKEQEEKEEEIKYIPLVKMWEDYLMMITGTVENRTIRNYRLACNAFHAFMEKHLNMTPLQFDFKMYNQFLVYLRKNYAPNTQAKYLKTFKRFLNHVIKEGYKVGFDVDDISYKETSGVMIAVSQEILDKIYTHKFTGFLDKVRWVFLLQCYTGLRISDLFRIMDNISGNFIRFETQKIKGDVIEQPITPIVREILKKLNNEMPHIYEQDYREGIKKIYEAVDSKSKIQIRDHKTNSFKTVFVHQEISSHDAVRTFITLCDQKGMTTSSIAKMTGKSVAVILKHYLVSSVSHAQKEMMDKWVVPAKTKTRTSTPAKRKNSTLSLFA